MKEEEMIVVSLIFSATATSNPSSTILYHSSSPRFVVYIYNILSSQDFPLSL